MTKQFDKYRVRLKFPERTCKQCIRYPCFQGIENCRCDFAKYGCKSFKINDCVS